MSTYELAQMATEFNEEGNTVRHTNVIASVRKMLKTEYKIDVLDFNFYDDLLSKKQADCERRADANSLINDNNQLTFEIVQGVSIEYSDTHWIRI